MEEQRYYKVAEAAQLMRLSPKTVYRLIKQEEIKGFKIGAAVLVPKLWLDRYLQQREAACGCL